MKYLTSEQAATIFSEHEDELIQVWFIKRTNGEERHMICRWTDRFQAAVLGGMAGKMNPFTEELWPVIEHLGWKRDAETQPRMIPLDSIYRIETEDDIWQAGVPDRLDEPPKSLEEMQRDIDKLF